MSEGPEIVCGFTPAARAAFVRFAGSSLFGDVSPLLANMTAASSLPTEQLADAFLNVHRDWPTEKPKFAVLALLKLEKANRAIIERHRQEAAAEAAARPTKGKPKRTQKAGRR